MRVSGSCVRVFCGIACGWLLACVPALAQQVVTPGFGGCGRFDEERRLEFTLAAPVSAGQTLSLAVAVAPGLASGLSVGDSRGTIYLPLAASRGRERGAAAVVWGGRLQQGLSAGDRLQLRLDSLVTDTRACVLALGYVDLLVEPRALRSANAARGQGAQPSLSLLNTTPAVAQAALAVFAFESSPGALTAAADLAVLGPICASGGTPCLALAHAQGDTGSAIAPSLVLTAAQAVGWQGAAVVLPRASLFRDGFES